MYKPRYQTAGGQLVYREVRWWQRIFGHQPRYIHTPPATDADDAGEADDDGFSGTDNDPPATSSDA